MGYDEHAMSAPRTMILGFFSTACFVVGCARENLPPPKVAEPTFSTVEPQHQQNELLATIVAQSSPTGALVLLDGKPVGKTPVTVGQLKPGSYDVTFKDEVSGDVTMNVQLAEGEYRTVKYNLVPRATTDAPASAKQ